MEEIIIIGAGASGMFSAIKLKKKGIRVTVLEKNAEALKKIYATGNGRCNITNTSIDVKNYFGQNPKFAYSSIKNFTHTLGKIFRRYRNDDNITTRRKKLPYEL